MNKIAFTLNKVSYAVTIQTKDGWKKKINNFMYPNVGIFLGRDQTLIYIVYRVGFLSAVCGQNGHLVNV